MSHRKKDRGKRSSKSRLRRKVVGFILKQAFHDIIWAETVCRTNYAEVVNWITITYPEDAEGLYPSVAAELADPGLVLIESRGRGALQ